MQQTHFSVSDKKFIFNLKAVLADAPARSFIKCCSTHNAYHGCERCKQKGEWYRNSVEKRGRVIFPQSNADNRTNAEFVQFIDKRHQSTLSPLLQLGLGLVTDIPLDYMHLVCLGVTRKFLHTWLKGKLSYRISSLMANIISKRLLDLAQFIPAEFSRRPRSLSEIEFWKATEYRQFLVYLSPIVLHGILPRPKYEHFLLLHAAMYILLSCNADDPDWNRFAKDLLHSFVSRTPDLYGREFLIYNLLLHLADDGLKFGPLDNVCAFCFENYMQQIKRILRKMNNHLQQVVRRISEDRKSVV